MLKISLKPHRSSLKAGNAAEQKVFVMLKVIPDIEASRTRAPIALALVIDTSSSMKLFADQQTAKALAARKGMRGQISHEDGGGLQSFNLQLPTLLDQAIDAVHSLVEDARLTDEDRISVIHFDDQAHVLISLTPVAQKARIHGAIESLREHSGGTRMAKGLRCAIEELGSLPTEIAKRTLVFTDGATFDENECLGILPRFSESNTPIIGIGFGDEYRRELLEKMADATQGRPYHLRDVSDLGAVLQDEVGQTVKELVTDLKMTFTSVRGVRLDAVTRVYPSLAEVSLATTPYRLGNIVTGDYTVILLEMTVSGAERPPGRVRLGQINLAAAMPGTGSSREFVPQDLIVNFTHDSSALAMINEEIMGYAQQKSVRRLVEEAVRAAPSDTSRAQQSLKTAAGMTQRLGNEAMTQMLNDTMNELSQTGKISPGTSNTVALGLRTRTMKTSAVDDGATGGLSPEEIRRLSGT